MDSRFHARSGLSHLPLTVTPKGDHIDFANAGSGIESDVFERRCDAIRFQRGQTSRWLEYGSWGEREWFRG